MLFLQDNITSVMKRQKYLISFIAVAVSLIYSGLPSLAVADPTTSLSTNYSLQDTFFGSGSQINVCSSSYCAKAAVGALTVGNPSGTNYQLHAGFDTTGAPYLIFVVTPSSNNLGVINSSSSATTTGTFSVGTYQSGQYEVQTVSSPPSNGQGHSLATATGSCVASPAPGTEFFGMNLVANTYPSSFGANPAPNSVAGAAVGQAASGYATTNCFKYNTGDVIAQSASPGNTTGEIGYTISYIFNINNGTPDGTYTFNDVLVATGTY